MGAFTIYAIKSALCLALLYLPYTLLMRRDTFHTFNRVLLLSIVALSLVLPLFNIPVISNALPFEEISVSNELDEAFSFVEEDVPMMEDTYAITPTATVKTIEKPVITWASILVLIYIIGVVVCLGWKGLQLIRLYRYIPSNCLWKDTIDGIKVYAHFDEVCPFSWMNTIVINDEDFRNNPSVMQHERAHIRLHHSWDNLFVSAVEVLQWFNPCIWMLDSSLREVHEYEADAAVLTQGITLPDYQRLLIRKAIGTSSYAFANGFNHSLLKKRIKMMMKKKTNRWSCTKALYLLPVAAVALAAFATPEFTEKADAISDSNLVTSLLSPQRGEEALPFSPSHPLWVLNGNMVDWTYSFDEKAMEGKIPEEYISQVTNIPVGLIESISILKSTAAIRKWGSKGENGVVEIVAGKRTRYVPKVERGEIIYGHLYDNDGPVHATISEVKDDNKTVVQSVLPNEIGEFQLKVISPDNNLLITSPNHQQVRQPIRRTFYNIQMRKADSSSDINSEIIVRGNVVDENGKPMEKVYIVESDKYGRIVKQTETETNGAFALSVQDSEHVVRAVYNGYKSVKLAKTNQQQKIIMKPDQNIISGIVVDEQGKPLIMATITEKDEDNEMRIWTQKLPNAKGQFTIRVYDLSHYLSVSCPGYETQKVKITGHQLKVVLKESNDTAKFSTTDTSPIEGEILRICENMPQFPGGERAMLKFIAENARYPENAQKAGVEGMAVVEFIVDKKGKIHEPRIIKGLTPAFDEEVLRVVRAMPDWEPGTMRGEKKNVKFTLPVTFKLDQAKKK